MTEKKRVAVLFGGQSGEHEVSLVSARSVIDALDPEKYDVLPVGITREGQWLAGPGAMPALLAQADRAKLPGGAATASESAAQQETALTTSQFSILNSQSSIDVVFPVLHGPMGEDGTVQGLLELAGVPYVGCGVLASAVGMDKPLMKAAFAAAGLPLLPWLLLRRGEMEADIDAACARVEEALVYPMFVKPANMGSSVGISKVRDRAQLVEGLREAARYDRRIVVEQGIIAREIEISVLGNEEPVASVPGEIVPSGEWYDYAAKYIDGQSQLLIPAPISAEQARRVAELALGAYATLDCSGLARVDFLLDKERGDLYLNEVNTMPGFTSVSMYAKLWEASGLSYAELVDRLISLAVERVKGKG
jgi:D-alanine-D-alanine ligase